MRLVLPSGIWRRQGDGSAVCRCQNLPSGARFFRCAASSSTINTRDFH